MKTKSIFKIFTIIMMLMLSIFTTGCESQQEKYTKACNDIATYQREFAQKIVDKVNKYDSEVKNKESLEKMVKEINELFDTYEKTLNDKMENLQKIAKGNPELEKDVRIKWDEFNKKRNEILKFKIEVNEFMKEVFNDKK